MKIALIQPDTAWENPKSNISKAGTFIRDAKARGAELALLPEMFSTGFSMKAYSVEGAKRTPEALSAMAKENSIAVIAGVAATNDSMGPPGINKALAFDDSGALVAEYVKMHPFSFAGEDRHYAPGRGPVRPTGRCSGSLQGNLRTPGAGVK